MKKFFFSQGCFKKTRPKKTRPKKPKKTHLKKPSKTGFYWVFLGFIEILLLFMEIRPQNWNIPLKHPIKPQKIT